MRVSTVSNDRPSWLSERTIMAARRILRSHVPDQIGYCRGCDDRGTRAEWPCCRASVARSVLSVAMNIQIG